MIAPARRRSFGYNLPTSWPAGVDPTDPASLIDSVEFESNYTPQGLSINPNGPSDPNAPYAQYLRSLQPKAIVHFKAGLPSYSIAPYGNPGPSQFGTIVTIVELAGAGLVGLLAFSMISIMKKKKVL